MLEKRRYMPLSHRGDPCSKHRRATITQQVHLSDVTHRRKHDTRHDILAQTSSVPIFVRVRAGLQVQCVREVLLQMSSMYTDLAMRADLPASTRGVQVRPDSIPGIHCVGTN